MRSVDSLSNYSMDSKPKKTPWGSLSSGSINWDTLESIDNPGDSDLPNYSRSLDYPDSWKRLDLPREVSETSVQEPNTPHTHTPEEETETRKRPEDIERKIQELLDMLNQAISPKTEKESESTATKNDEQKEIKQEKEVTTIGSNSNPNDDNGKRNESEISQDFIDSINNCNSYQEMINLIDKRVKELSSQSKKVARMGAKQGVMGRSAFSSITHYDGFITPETIIDGSWDGGITYHIYDNDYLYRFASGIKRQNLPKNANLLQQIMPMLDSYFGFPKDSTDNREKVLDEWMIQNAESFYEKHPEKRQSEWFENGFDQMSISGDAPISAFEGKNVAQCIERATLAQNLLKICGYDSEIAFGYCASREKTEAHAFNLVKIGDKDYLIDFSNTVHKYMDGKFVGRQPYYVILDQNNKDAFLSGKKIVESIDYHYENDKRVNENRIRKYKIGDN